MERLVENLTEKQKRVLEFIEKYSAKFERSPTFEEIQNHFSYKSVGTVHDFITALKSKGYLEKNSRRWNGLGLVKDSSAVPLLGKVAAGRPIQYQKFDEKIDIPKSMVTGNMGNFFALQVLGDSMIDEGILEDDYVIVQKQESANNGQIVVALLDDEATIKHFYKKKSQIELHSANTKYAPIIVKPQQDFKIAGILRGLIRKIL
jgi:repressor LexA